MLTRNSEVETLSEFSAILENTISFVENITAVECILHKERIHRLHEFWKFITFILIKRGALLSVDQQEISAKLRISATFSRTIVQTLKF